MRPRRVPGAPGNGHRPTAPLAAHLWRPGASTHFRHKGRSSRSPSVPDLHRDSSGAATVLPGSYHRAAPCMAQGPAVGPVQAYYVPDTEPVQEPVGSAKTTVLRGAAGHRAFLDVVPALAPQGGRRFRFAAHKAAGTMGNAVPGRLPSPGGWGKGSRDPGVRRWRLPLVPRACARAVGMGLDVESSGWVSGSSPWCVGSSLAKWDCVRTKQL